MALRYADYGYILYNGRIVMDPRLRRYIVSFSKKF
jgi:hypothetical protein